jgi:hypothetical protein
MIRSRIIAALALAAALLGAAPEAIAQRAPGLRNPNIAFDYYEPRNQALVPLYQRLQKRQVLENLSQFLAPVKWPKKLRLIMKECPAAAAGRPQVFYIKVERSLTVCYQWLAFLGNLRAPAFATKQEIIVGGLVGMVLHEAARAAFDMLGVPVLGSEVEAADQVSAFTALQFGERAAQAVIKGTYYIWKTYDDDIIRTKRPYDFAGSAGIPRQRMYNVLCIAYGGAPDQFKSFVEAGDLLAGRAENCEAEYRQVQAAFRATILKRVDEGMMKKVLVLDWLTADDLQPAK